MMPFSDVSEYRVDTAAVFATFGSPKISYSGYLSKSKTRSMAVLKMTLVNISSLHFPSIKDKSYASIMTNDSILRAENTVSTLSLFLSIKEQTTI